MGTKSQTCVLLASQKQLGAFEQIALLPFNKKLRPKDKEGHAATASVCLCVCVNRYVFMCVHALEEGGLSAMDRRSRTSDGSSP